jgi:DNA segregation ATPase FtsK/SpoIIIE, S-DNA-T family
MARKKKSGRDELTDSSFSPGLKEETKHTIIAIVFLVIAVFFILSPLEKAGPVGRFTFNGFSYLLGIGYYLVPLIFGILSITYFRSRQRPLGISKLIGAVLFMVTTLGVGSILLTDSTGVVGDAVAYPFIQLFDTTVSFIFLASLAIISLLIIVDARPQFGWLAFWRKQPVTDIPEDDAAELVTPIVANSLIDDDEPEDDEEPVERAPRVAEAEAGESGGMFGRKKPERRVLSLKPYTPPALSLLENDRGKPGVGDIKANANIIKRTLANFGITVEMDEISIGPTVTRYALKPAEGVKLSRIVALQNDLALALAAHPIRIEAPIPGKSLVGIEIPNSTKTVVGLGSLLGEEEYRVSDKSLLVSLGKGISGKSYFANLAKSPHLLVAGATGSGKSVTIHALITSLLYRNSPEQLKFIMVDPKRVELTLYNSIPHLLTPVITDAKKAIMALKWAAKEMDRRYDILQAQSVRDIDSYHKNIFEPALKHHKAEGATEASTDELPEPMPYIVFIIDELADIMQSYPRELEAGIVRLAQMSRAVGIHLILSTQRPSVNVITGLIKANIPSRIALQVTSQIDSRTILDTPGAEKLLGAGDMLYMSGEMSKPQRIQSAYVSETELKKVVKYLADSYANEVPSEINFEQQQSGNSSIFESTLDDDEEEDELYEEAKGVVIQAGKASTSYLQRKLRVGYARAARLMDILEERGIIGPGEGSKPREVISRGDSGGMGGSSGQNNQNEEEYVA